MMEYTRSIASSFEISSCSGDSFGKLHFLAFEAIEDDRRMERALVLEIDEKDLFHAGMNQLFDVVRMHFVAGAVQLFSPSPSFTLTPRAKLRPTSFFLASRVIGDLGLLNVVEKLDDRSRRLETQRAQKNRGEDPLLAVDLGVDQLFLLVDLELQQEPR